MDPHELDEMRKRWKANEAELERLKDLPVGPIDPANRAAEIDREQDEIEYEIGRPQRHERRGELPNA